MCLPAREAVRVEAAVADARAPFEIDYTRGEDLDICDAWRITGGTAHGGGFNVLPGYERDSRLIHEFPSRWLTNSTTTPNDLVDRFCTLIGYVWMVEMVSPSCRLRVGLPSGAA